MKKKQNKAFTVIELTFVIIIISILILLIRLKAVQSHDLAKLTNLKNNIIQLQHSIELHYLDKNYWPFNHIIEPFTKETLEKSSTKIINDEGNNVELAEDLYYAIDFEAIENYSKKPNDDILYVVQESTKKVFALGKLTNQGRILQNDIATRKPKVIDIAVGYYHALFLKNDGKVWGFGDGSYGNLGNNKDDMVTHPEVIQKLSNIEQVITGETISFAIEEDGTVWTWGDNYYGNAGTEEDYERYYEPVQVPQLKNAKKISTYTYHTLVLENDGTVSMVGYNSYGEACEPVKDTGSWRGHHILQKKQIASDVKDIAAGFYITLILKNDGTVWGCGTGGYMGDGTFTNRTSLTQALNLKNIVKIYTSYFFSFALEEDGTVWAFGENETDIFGSDAAYWQLTPVQIKIP